MLAWQQRLSAAGYWLGSPDGSFGLLTEQATLALQKAAGLARDGVAGPASDRALVSGVVPKSKAGTVIVTSQDSELVGLVGFGLRHQTKPNQ